MKIAILTQPLRRNYGGILQAYALQVFLKKYHHDVVVINREYNCNRMTLSLLFLRLGSVIKSFVRLFLLGKKEYVVMNPFSYFYHTKWNGIDVLPFVNKYICRSKEIRSSEALHKYLKKKKFDCFVVGSDQVWRPCYSPCITDFFLKEIPKDSKAIKFAYAASFGTDQWEFSDSETKECALLAKEFNAISVREKSGIHLCKKYLGVSSVHLLDPTMLLDAEDYIKLFKDAAVPKSFGNVFCYVLDENKESDSIITYLQKEGYVPVYASLDVFPTKENPRPCQLSVEEWLRGIFDAEFVVTDSFHACVFSILFKKPFVVVGNKERGNARFESLLEMFGLQKRMVESCALFHHSFTSLKNNEDVIASQYLLKEYRLMSASFLKNMKIL